MINPGERPSGITKEYVDRRIHEIKDPVEQKRLLTIANIMDPYIRHRESMNLSKEQIDQRRREAVELGRLEAVRLRESLNKGMVHRLDTLFEEVAKEHPQHLGPLRKASSSVRGDIRNMKKHAVTQVEHYGDYDTPEEYLQ